MKKIFLILLFAGLRVPGISQYDSSFFNTYYEQKVTQFRLIKHNQKKQIVFLGDSITDIAEWSNLLNNNKVLNRGISGDNTFGVLHRLDEIISRKPVKIFIMIGINDLARSIPDSIILRNYNSIITALQRQLPQTKIFIQSILPTNKNFSEFKNHQNKTAHIDWLNEHLQQLATTKNITFINLYPLFTNTQGELDTKFTNDGLHLKGEGYKMWIKYLHEKKYL